uniref:Tail protein n=1 Tax=viral metagenome TaxID=1070528 RepID=A0A6M3LU12_9ZZZZ
MASGDVNAILRTYLVTALAAEAWVARIYCPRLPEGARLPALAFFVRGGTSTPYIPAIVSPSVQFDCWGTSPIEARSVYIALYDCLQGIENVTVGAYKIKSAIEEVQGYEMQDVEFPGYHRVVTFFEIMLQI